MGTSGLVRYLPGYVRTTKKPNLQLPYPYFTNNDVSWNDTDFLFVGCYATMFLGTITLPV